MDFDTIIIGGGMSGFAAGIRCAYYNKKVCIIEKHKKIGGLNSFYKKAGHVFDVGLHALTNYVPRKKKNTPLPKLLRQLRLSYDDFNLCEQKVSCIKFNSKTLYFNNDLEFLLQNIGDTFPKEIDNFNALLSYILEFNALDLTLSFSSAREIVKSFISDPLLIDMIFCPLMFYGSAKENDINFAQFVIMFKSIFCEGFARPEGGVRQIIGLLLRKYLDLGGKLMMRSAVSEILIDSNNHAKGVRLENGEKIWAEKVVSSVGYFETMTFCYPKSKTKFTEDARVGTISFVELICLLNREMKDIGYNQSIFFLIKLIISYIRCRMILLMLKVA